MSPTPVEDVIETGKDKNSSHDSDDHREGNLAGTFTIIPDLQKTKVESRLHCAIWV